MQASPGTWRQHANTRGCPGLDTLSGPPSAPLVPGRICKRKIRIPPKTDTRPETIFDMPTFGFDLTDWFTSNAKAVDGNLQPYFGGGKDAFTGRWFEEFASIGDPNRFEPSDVLAVEALSVEVPPEAAARLLVTDPERFNEPLRQIPREQDIWSVRRLDVDIDSAADKLHAALRTLPRVDW